MARTKQIARKFTGLTTAQKQGLSKFKDEFLFYKSALVFTLFVFYTSRQTCS